MSTHNIFFHGEIRKICGYPLLSVAMNINTKYTYVIHMIQPCSLFCTFYTAHVVQKIFHPKPTSGICFKFSHLKHYITFLLFCYL